MTATTTAAASALSPVQAAVARRLRRLRDTSLPPLEPGWARDERAWKRHDENTGSNEKGDDQ